MANLNHYDVLGVSTDFTRDLLRSAYQAKLFEAHPDKRGQAKKTELGLEDSEVAKYGTHNPHLDSKVTRLIGKVTVDDIKIAYSVLSDPKKRTAYDLRLHKECLIIGYEATGTGLDEYTLDEFSYEDRKGAPTWSRDCPRCTSDNSMMLREADLEEGILDGSGGYRVAVSCQICSLWIMVLYDEED